MKERVFYVVNLDKQRIGILSLFLFALFFSFFFLGVSVGKGRSEVQSTSPNGNTSVSLNKAQADVNSINSSEDSIPLPKTQNMEVPMADISSASQNQSGVSTQANITNPYYAETSTAKDEEEEKKAQVIDLTKPTSVTKKTETKQSFVALKNQSPSKPKITQKKEVATNVSSQGPLYTIQLGAFSTRESAENLVSKVNAEKSKSKAFIVYKTGLFVVQMGKSHDKETLSKQLNRLKSEFRSKAMIVSFIPLNR